MSNLDYAIVAVYMAIVLAIGIWLSRRMKSGKDFFLGGRMLPWWAIGMSLVVSDIGAKDMVGLAQDAYRHGIVMANWDWLGCIPAMVLAAVVFVPYFWAGGFYTVPEYFGRRYNEGVQAIATIVWGLFIAGNVAVIFSASTGVIATMLGIPEYETYILIASAAFVGIYTFSGGLAAVVYTDVIQCIVMVIGMVLVLWFAWHHPAIGGADGWDAARASITAAHPDHFELFHPASNPSSFTTFGVVFGLAFVLGPAYWIGNQVIVQRVLGARSVNHARGGVLFGALIKTVFPVLLVTPGILALAILPEELSGDDTKNVFPQLVKDLLPGGARGLLFAAMIAGMMGNLDSYLNSASTLWTRDILRKYFLKHVPDDDSEASGKLDLILGRTLIIVFLVIGAGLAPLIDRIFETMQWMLSLFQGPSLALLVFGMFWKRATAWGGLAGMVLGLGASAVLDRNATELFGYENPYLHVAFWSFVASCVALVAVSLFTTPYSTERLRGLVWGSPRGSGEAAPTAER